MSNFRIRMAGKGTAEVYLYDEIGASPWGGGVSAKQFADELKAAGKIDRIQLRVNSPGGDVFDGLAIYNQLKRHPAHVEADIDGMALSIASVIVMAADEIRMAQNAMMMIHDPWTVAVGTAADFRKQADLMDQVKGNLVQTYVGRTGLRDDEISDLMSKETWLTSEDALQNGFVDRITDELQVAAKFDLSKFRNAPAQLLAARAEQGNSIYRAKVAELAARASRICGIPSA